MNAYFCGSGRAPRVMLAALSPAIIGILLTSIQLCAGAETTTAQREKLVAEAKYAEAYDAYQRALSRDPKNPALLYNAGLMAYLIEKPEEAIAPWTALKELEPNDWQVRAKLVQAFEAAGKKEERDDERKALFELREETDNPELKQARLYCRDQFHHGKVRIMVFEHFELSGPRAIRLDFVATTPSGKRTGTRYSLGSYDLTNEIYREHLQNNGKPGDRLFHLDAYHKDGKVHELYATFVGEPGYDEVKDLVVKILEGKREPESSTTQE